MVKLLEKYKLEFFLIAFYALIIVFACMFFA